ncbi:hypothetical protein FRC04_001384 [Tulasnella sp. 424]|nr:hypothetical protein FRC04_001384 [Tulasnella sp. 424]
MPESTDLKHAVQSIRRLLDDAYLTIDAENRGRRSGKASLSSLPVEIFLTIVKKVLLEADRYHEAGYYGQLTELCLVSKGWAETIHGLPGLWTPVDPYSSEELLKVVLSRSGELPLDIKGYVGSLSVAEMIQSEAHRWRSLDIISDEGCIMDSLMSKPAPRLQELAIAARRYWVPQTNVFGGTAPKLEAVMLQGCPLPWKSPILSDLKKLALYRIEEGAPDMNALLDILAASPQLSSLQIGFTHIPISPLSRRVNLPNLRLLKVEYLYLEVMTQVLSSIEAPMSARCIFRTRLDDEEDTSMEEQLATISERLVVLAQSVRDSSSILTLQMGDGESEDLGWDVDSVEEEADAVLTYEDEGGHLGPLSITVSSPPTRHVDVLSHLAGKIRPYTKSSPPKLRLVDMHRTLPEDETANLLCALHRTFPNVQEIALIDITYPAMIDALRRIFPQPASNIPPLFSRLTTLTVKRRSHGDWAVWLQGHRRRTGKKGGVSPLPRTLTMRLEGGSIGAKALGALKQLVPGTLSLDNVHVNEKA